MPLPANRGSRSDSTSFWSRAFASFGRETWFSIVLLIVIAILLLTLILRPPIQIFIVQSDSVTFSSVGALPPLLTLGGVGLLASLIVIGLAIRTSPHTAPRMWDFISFLLFMLLFLAAFGAIVAVQTPPGEALASGMDLPAFLRSIALAGGIALSILVVFVHLRLLPNVLCEGLISLFDNFGGYVSRFLAVSFIWGGISAVIAAVTFFSIVVQQEAIYLLRIHPLQIRFANVQSLAEWTRHSGSLGIGYIFEFLDAITLTQYYEVLLITISVSLFVLVQLVMGAWSLGYVFLAPERGEGDAAAYAYQSIPLLLVGLTSLHIILTPLLAMWISLWEANVPPGLLTFSSGVVFEVTVVTIASVMLFVHITLRNYSRQSALPTAASRN